MNLAMRTGIYFPILVRNLSTSVLFIVNVYIGYLILSMVLLSMRYIKFVFSLLVQSSLRRVEGS